MMVKTGRPRAESLDAAILDATEELVITQRIYKKDGVDRIGSPGAPAPPAPPCTADILSRGHVIVAAMARRFGLRSRPRHRIIAR